MSRSARRQPSRRLVAVLLLVGAALIGCESSGASAAQLTWCAANQDEVGRAAIRLGLIGDPLTYGEWKENNPDAYERACIEAYQEA